MPLTPAQQDAKRKRYLKARQELAAQCAHAFFGLLHDRNVMWEDESEDTKQRFRGTMGALLSRIDEMEELEP